MLTPITDGVYVHQSELLRNNAVVVQGPTGMLLVDPGITGGEMSCLAGDLRELGRPVVAGFATHPDWDHVLWHTELGDAPRYGTARCADVMLGVRSDPGWRSRVVEALPPEIADDVPLDPLGLIEPLPAGTSKVPWDGPTARIVEHPAHSPGHAALLIEGCRVLIAGDMLSDLFVPMLDDFDSADDPVEDYLAGLRTLEGLAPAVDIVIPGHGSVGLGDQVRARIDQDRAYLHALRDDRLVPDDPRITAAAPGWEWVADVHAGQAASIARRRDR